MASVRAWLLVALIAFACLAGTTSARDPAKATAGGEGQTAANCQPTLNTQRDVPLEHDSDDSMFAGSVNTEPANY